MLTDEQKRFEKIHCGGNLHATRKDTTTGDYVLPSVQDAWAGWRSAIEAEVRAEAQEPVAWKWRRHAMTKWEMVANWDAIEEMAALEMEKQGWDVVRLFSAPQPPAPCPKCEGYSYMSWSGNNVYGDASSINTVKDAVHYAGQVPELKDTIKFLQAKVAELTIERDTWKDAESITQKNASHFMHKNNEQIAEIERLTKDRDEWETACRINVALRNDANTSIAQQAERIAQVEIQRDNYFALNVELNQVLLKQYGRISEQAALIELLCHAASYLPDVGINEECLAAIAAHKS